MLIISENNFSKNIVLEKCNIYIAFSLRTSHSKLSAEMRLAFAWFDLLIYHKMWHPTIWKLDWMYKKNLVT